MLKRIGLFLLVNFLVIITISTVLSVLGIGGYLSNQGINYQSLLIFCLAWGMIGSFISLQMSRFMAKRLMGVKVIDSSKSREDYEVKLMAMVHQISRKAGLTTMPEVGIFDSAELNAFATGPSKNRSLVAVSSGLLNNMTPKEVEGVIAHEVAHIANGDMVTMTLLQGIVNAFVMFMARILAQIVSSALNKNSNSNRSPGLLYFGLVWVFEIALMILGSMVVAGFSRYREYRADHGGAKLSSKEAMISALQALQKHSNQKTEETPPAIAALQISSKSRIALLFSTHPPLEDRIQALMDL